MLKATNLSKSYGEVKALKGVDLNIKKGELYGLLGPNGAGKTTTISILSALFKQDKGEVWVDGKNLSTCTSTCKKMIGVVPQEIALYEDLTAYENLRFWGRLYGIKGNELEKRIDQNLKFLGLHDRRHHRIKTYSGGMKRRINIAAALLHTPQLIFMDEPTVGIDPQSRNLIFEVIEELHKQGHTLIYTTHYMEEAERLCDRIGIIDEGKIVAEGTLDELQKSSKAKNEIRVELINPEKEQLDALTKLYNGNLCNSNSLVTLSTDHVDVELPMLVKNCSDRQLHISNLKIENISLESIFLELTGKQLRD